MWIFLMNILWSEANDDSNIHLGNLADLLDGASLIGLHCGLLFLFLSFSSSKLENCKLVQG